GQQLGHAESRASPGGDPQNIPKRPPKSTQKIPIGFTPPADLSSDWRADVAQRLVDLHPKYFPKGRGLDLHTAEGIASHFNQWPKSERAGMVEPVLKALAWRLQRSKVKGPAQFLEIINRPGNEGTRQWLEGTEAEMQGEPDDSFAKGEQQPKGPATARLEGTNPEGAVTWDEALELIREQVSESNFKTWFQATCQEGFEAGAWLLVITPNHHFVRWLSTHYREVIEGALKTGVEVELRCGL
ncbi:MAG TPA: DnaA N-terminal domain-containing protein, partial [Acidobacteriota bacterium]|nr:DnaA N-terminal domain-containing protein [Acidobacteriota bacterium]